MRGRLRPVAVLLATLGSSACDGAVKRGSHEEVTSPATNAPRVAAPAPKPIEPTSPQPTAAAPRSSLVIGGPAAVEGQLRSEQVSQLIARRHDDLRACQAAMQGAPAVVEAQLALDVSSTGEISKASLESQNTYDATLTACLTDAAQSWALPAVHGSDGSRVTYPFRLEQGDL